MKIEPRNTAKVPKYAAVLAAAVMLTGCGYDDVLATDGTAPADYTAELAGEAQPLSEEMMQPVQTEDTGQTDASAAETTETAAATDEEPFMLAGDVVTLDGDVDVPDDDGGEVCGQTTQMPAVPPESRPRLAGLVQVREETNPEIPDFQPTAQTTAAEQEQILNRWRDACSEHGWTVRESPLTVSLFGSGFQRMLSCEEPELMIVLFDGSAADSTGLTMREWVDRKSTELFGWGALSPKPEATENMKSMRAAFVDITGNPDPAVFFEDTGL